MHMRPNWSAQHLTTATQFPARPEIGRAYFIDDEGVIRIDHGQGVITYGNRPGPQGPPGSPAAELQEDICDTDEAVITLAHLIHDLTLRHSQKPTHKIILTALQALQAEIFDLDEGLLEVLAMLRERKPKPEPHDGKPHIPANVQEDIFSLDEALIFLLNFMWERIRTDPVKQSMKDDLAELNAAVLDMVMLGYHNHVGHRRDEDIDALNEAVMTMVDLVHELDTKRREEIQQLREMISNS